MSKSMNKFKLIMVLALVMVMSVCVGMFAFAKAEPVISSVDEVTTFQMDGAELLIEGEGKANGIQFTASISAEEFEAVKSLGEVETGLIIAPAYYHLENAFSKDNLFGAEAVYDWAEWDNETYNYVYNGEKIRVININANSWVESENGYSYSGAIIDILDENVQQYFTGFAYIGVNGNYVLTDMITTSVGIELTKLESVSWIPSNWAFAEKMVEEGVDLVNAEGETEFDVADYMGAIPGATFKMIDATGKEATLVDGKLDLTDGSNFRVWTLIVTVAGFDVYECTIDLFDRTAKLVWNTISEDSLAYFDAYYPSGADFLDAPVLDASISKVGDVDTIAVSNIKKHGGGDPGEAFFTLSPIHSKEYYAQYVGKEVAMNLGMYFETDIVPGVNDKGEQMYIVNQGAVGYNNGILSVPKANTWHNATIELDTIVENWDSIVEGKGTYDWNTRDDVTFFYALMTHFKPSEDLIYHFAGFDFVMDVTALAVKGGNILVKLDDVADKTALDLTSYMKAEDAEMISSVGAFNALTYEMKGYSIADTIAVTDLTAVDVSNAKSAAYVLNVKSGETVVYSATFDLYNSTDEVVWAESLTEYNVVTAAGGYTTGRAKPTSEKAYEIVTATAENPVAGKTEGQFIKFTSTASENILLSVKALHTQEYYREVIGGKNYVMWFRAYKDAKGEMTGFGMNGQNNFGMYNTYSNYRAGGDLSDKWENMVMSLDNYLLCTEASYTGATYDFNSTLKTGTKVDTMMQIEVKTASADNSPTIYIGDFKIVEGYETLMVTSTAEKMRTDVYTTNLSVDLNGAETFDLRDLLDEMGKTKYNYYISKVGVDPSKGKGGNAPIYWTVTLSDGTQIKVVANAQDDPATILNVKEIADKITAGTVSIKAVCPNLAVNGLGSHPVTMVNVKVDFTNAPVVVE